MKRRDFNKVGVQGFALATLFQSAKAAKLPYKDYGPLVKDPDGVIDLPKGFNYTAISMTNEIMSDGLPVPARHDGMAAFAGPNGTIRLVRNHENNPIKAKPELPLLKKVKPEKVYDRGFGKSPSMGGTTTLTYDPVKKELVEHHMSLAGTIRNCSGGPTPWGSWITCEENLSRASDRFEQDHGYCFEVPANAEGLLSPEPLKEMGRFNHEAIAIDLRSGVVYLTEDRPDGLLYRYLPKDRRHLNLGGQLQALCIVDKPSFNTSNRPKRVMEFGQKFSVKWIDLDDVTAPNDDLRFRGIKAGAASFSGGEGIWYHEGQIIFTCKSGGKSGLGQTFIYRPDEFSGDRFKEDGTVELFVEPNDKDVYNSGDNLTVHPNGEVYICEDGKDLNGVIRISPEGKVMRFLRNRMNSSEMCGGSFSADGKIFFVNMQSPGITFAIHGPF